ncbi:MAG: putative signal transducing protein [Bacteroidales bacterium]
MTQEQDWTIVFSSGKNHLATMAEQHLQNAGIPAVQMNKKDSSYLFGQIDVMVEKDFANEALELINQFKKDLEIV